MPCPYPQDLMNTQNGIRLTATTMEAFLKGERVAAHARSHVLGGYTTLKEHMPSEHRDYAEWSPQRFIRWAGKIGVATARLGEKILSSRPYAEQGYRSCMGIIRLGRHYEPERVEAASLRALKYNTCSYRSLKAILSAGLDKQRDAGEHPAQMSLPLHQNIRRQEYYQS